MKSESENIIKIGETEGDDLTEISNSKLKTATACPKMYGYRYNEKLTPKRKPVALHFGGLLHETFEVMFKGGSVKDKIMEVKAEWDNMMDEEKEYYGRTVPQDLVSMVKRYRTHWAEHDADSKILCVEQDFKIRIEGTPVVYVGKIDYIQERPTGIYPSDLKTCKTIPDDEFRIMDTQSANYLWALKLLAPQLGFDPEDIRGFVFDYIRKKMPVVPDVLASGKGLSKRANMDTDYDTYYKAILDNGFDPDDYEDMLSGLKYKSKKFFARRMIMKSDTLLNNVFMELVKVGTMIHYGSFPDFRNIGLACDRCSYKSLCQADMLGYDRESIISMEYNRRDKEESSEDVPVELELEEIEF